MYRALRAGVAAILAGERDPAAARALMGQIIEAEPLAQLDYAEVVDADSFRIRTRSPGISGSWQPFDSGERGSSTTWG